MPDRLRLADFRVLRPFAGLLALTLIAAPAPAETTAPMADPVRVADLIDLPILDANKVVLGRVRGVVRTDEGKIQLLMPLGGLFGFGERLVPIPIENVALSRAEITALEVPPDRFQKSPTWYGHQSEALAATETISINRR
jgi:hypothetical protein